MSYAVWLQQHSPADYERMLTAWRIVNGAWKPEYGEMPSWLPSDELVSGNGRDWYPEPRDAA